MFNFFTNQIFGLGNVQFVLLKIFNLHLGKLMDEIIAPLMITQDINGVSFSTHFSLCKNIKTPQVSMM